MNPLTLESPQVVGQRRRPHCNLGAHQQSLHEGYWDDNAGVTRRPMSASSRSLVHSMISPGGLEGQAREHLPHIL